MTKLIAAQPRHALELTLLVTLATLWGASYTFIKIGIETIPPITLIATRTAIAGAVLLAVMRVRGVFLPRDFATWKAFMIQACLNSVIPFTLIAWAEADVDAGLAVALNAMTPVFAFLLTWLWFRHEPTSLRKLIGVVLGLAGACVIVGPQALSGFGREVVAQCAVILASFCYAGAAIFGKRFNGIDPMATAAGSLICGTFILLPFSLGVDRPWTLQPSSDAVLALLALSVFSTALALTIYFRLVQTVGSVGVTSQGYLRVPIGVAISALFLGETPKPLVWLGIVMVLIGIAAITTPGRMIEAKTA